RVKYFRIIPSDKGLAPSPTNHTEPASCSWVRTYSITSHVCAPSRTMASKSLTRRSAVALSAFIGVALRFLPGHFGINPLGVPVVERLVAENSELFLVGIRPQICRGLDDVVFAVGQRQRDHLGVTAGRGRTLAAPSELLKGLLPQLLVVVTKE